MATSYEGDPCDNTKKFFKWLREERKTKGNVYLKGLSYLVFGLGDTSYEVFNAMGKYFNEGLGELGGERIYKYGEGNAEGNLTEDDFNEWKADMWRDIFQHYAALGPLEENKI